MELKHIEYFCAVAETENVTLAAQNLMVSQPYLTKKIKQLETELGVPLFDHVGRNIRLNEYGKHYYEYAKTILQALDNAQDRLDEMKGKITTTFSLYTNVSLYMPGLLGAFHKENPELTLVQSSAARNKIINALLSEEADFAICTPPIYNPDIETRLLFKDTALALLPDHHPLGGQKTLSLTDLDSQSFIITPVGYGMRDNMDIVFASKGVYPRIVIETADSSLMPAYVREGIGIAMIPGTVVFNNEALAAECKRIDDTDYLAHISLSWKKDRYKTKNHRLLVDFIFKYYNKGTVRDH